jgi:hypothetical protein
VLGWKSGTRRPLRGVGRFTKVDRNVPFDIFVYAKIFFEKKYFVEKFSIFVLWHRTAGLIHGGEGEGGGERGGEAVLDPQGMLGPHV